MIWLLWYIGAGLIVGFLWALGLVWWISRHDYWEVDAFFVWLVWAVFCVGVVSWPVMLPLGLVALGGWLLGYGDV